MTRRGLLTASAGSMITGQSRLFGNAEAYERFMGRWSKLVVPNFAAFARLDGTAEHLLDIGSGTGALALTVAAGNKQIRVTGIDPSSEYVAYANARHSFGSRIVFEQGDAQALTYPDATFSHCAALLVFNFIADPAKALAEARRVTQPKGTIAAAVWDYGGQMEMLRAFWDVAGELDSAAKKLDEKHMKLCRAGELTELWTRAGLVSVEETPLHIQMPFSSFDDFWQPFLLGQAPAGVYVRTLDERRKEALRKGLVRRLGVISVQDGFTLPARVHAVRGDVPQT